MNMLESGVDWLTLTLGDKLPVWEGDMASALTATLRDAQGGWVPHEREPWGWNGYAGWREGPLCFGARGDGTIVRVSGGVADRFARAPYLALWTCTRVDVQATLRLTERTPDQEIAYLTSRVRTHTRKGAGRPPTVRYVQTWGSGDTLYIGSRTSDVMMRVYNKEAERGDEPGYAGALRVEMEVKGSASRALWGTYGGRPDASRRMVESLRAAAQERGIYLLEELGLAEAAAPRTVPRETDDERTLQWLATSVSGAVGRLTVNGMLSSVLQALGLDMVVRVVDNQDGEQQLPMW